MKTLKNVCIALFVVLVAASLAVIGYKVKKIEEPDRNLTVLEYKIGTISDVDGEELDSGYALRSKMQSKDKFVKISVADGGIVKYRVFCYNADKVFIGAGTTYENDITELPETMVLNSKIETVSYYRVLLIVPETEDMCTVTNMNGYVEQVNVTVKK